MEKRLIKDLVLIPSLTAVLFVQQMAFSFIPNVQLTTLLILLYTKVLGFKRTSIIIILHVFTFNLLSPFGPSLIYEIPFILFAWLLFSALAKIVIDRPVFLAIFGFIYGFIYSWIMIIPAVFITKNPFIPYLISDLPFEFILALSNFLTIIWLYERLNKVLKNLLENFYQETK